MPGPDENKRTIAVFSRTKLDRPKNANRGHVINNCTRVQITKLQHLIRVNNTNGQSKQLEIAHLNAESLKCRQHFHEVKEMGLDKKFDILTISETWFNSTNTNASVEIDGYRIYRLDRLGKAGAGVCAYVKNGFKVNVLKDLSGI